MPHEHQQAEGGLTLSIMVRFQQGELSLQLALRVPTRWLNQV